MKRFLRFLFIIMSLFTLFTSSIFSEEKKVGFDKPEPFIDYEFEELQKSFLKKRKIGLAKLKNLPLNQYPEEFLQELINKVKREVKRELKRELKRRYRKYYPQKRKTIKKINKTELKRLKRITKAIEKKSIVRSNKPVTIKQKQVKKNREKIGEIKKGLKNNVVRFSIGDSNEAYQYVNSLHKIMISVSLIGSKEAKFTDVSIFVKNTSTGMVYLLKRFHMIKLNRKKSFSFLWQYPNIPTGKYKPYVVAQFYNIKRKYINQVSQFWGNNSSNKMHILFKN